MEFSPSLTHCDSAIKEITIVQTVFLMTNFNIKKAPLIIFWVKKVKVTILSSNSML